MSKKIYWFLRPRNETARDKLAHQLAGGWEQYLRQEIVEGESEPLKIIEVNSKIVDFVLKSQELIFIFRIFKRYGENSKIRDVTAQLKHQRKKRIREKIKRTSSQN